MRNLQALLSPLLASGLPGICDAGGRTVAIRRVLTEKGPVASFRLAAIFWGILFLLCGAPAEGQTAQSITLAWDIDTDPTVVGYNLCYGTSADSLTQVQNVGDPTTATVSGLTAGVTYLSLRTTPMEPIAHTQMKCL